MKGLPFSGRMAKRDMVKLVHSLEKFREESALFPGTHSIDLSSISNNEKRYLRERNIITYEMEISYLSHVLVNKVQDFSIMVNDEDHVRIQVIRPGLQFLSSYRLADKVDDELNRFVPYSFSTEYGYLTSCPSNIGTGIKVSAMLHLPVLTIQNKIPFLIHKIKKIGVNLAGTTGEGIKTIGSIYQLYNRTTLGVSEIDIVELMDGVVNKVLELEDNSRDKYLSESRTEVENLAWRSFGILLYSKKINYIEALEHLSNVRLGIILAIIKNGSLNVINDLMVGIQWAHLQRFYREFFKSIDESDEYRANYLRSGMQKMEKNDV